jgi:hypothetical protein
MKDPKIIFLQRLLELARITRRRASPEEAQVALEYEIRFEAELRALEGKLVAV